MYTTYLFIVLVPRGVATVYSFIYLSIFLSETFSGSIISGRNSSRHSGYLIVVYLGNFQRFLVINGVIQCQRVGAFNYFLPVRDCLCLRVKSSGHFAFMQDLTLIL